MLYKVLAISTLTALAAGELTNQALASPDSQVPAATRVTRSQVIAEASPTPQSVGAVTAPEALVEPEFSSVEGTGVGRVGGAGGEQLTSSPHHLLTSSSPHSITSSSSTNQDLVVTTTDIQIVGATEELQEVVVRTIATQPGGHTSQSQLNKDVEAILQTGLFTDARVSYQSSQDGWQVVYDVAPVVVRSLQLEGNQVLTPEVANDLFKSQLGNTISPTSLNQGSQALSQWYADNGYVLAQVVDLRSAPNGVITVEVAEGVIGDIGLRFLDQDGEVIEGRTREDFIKDELKLQPGDVFRVDVARRDLQQLYKLGLFDKVDISLNGDAKKADVTYELTERPARGINAGAGYNNDSGIFGTISYKDQNFGGVNQKVGLNLQVSSRDLQFDGNYGKAYRASNPDQPGYNISAFRRRSLSRTFDGDIELANGDTPREGRFGGGLTLTKPVDEWDASVGLNYTRTSIRDSDGNLTPVDELGNPLSFSGNGIDDLVTVSAAIAKDERDNPLNPTSGSILRFSTEQSVPVGNGNILMNRLQANYSHYTPIKLFGGEESEVLAFNVQGGTTIGDLPPYRAFNLGGANSVRGYGNGEVGSGRSYISASAEYRVPVLKPVDAVVFADFASDLGSGDTVPGEPGVVRGKPGTGFGYGAGLRLDSPLGVIRADYGFNDQGDSRLQVGIGQRF